MSESAILQQLEQARQQRRDDFLAEYRKLAGKYGCDFVARPHIADDGTIKCSITAVVVSDAPD